MHYDPMTSLITQAHISRDALPLPKQTQRNTSPDPKCFHAIKHTADQTGALSRPWLLATFTPGVLLTMAEHSIFIF